MSMKITFGGNKKIDAHLDGFTVHTDQPVKGGGDGTAPAPFSLFLASIGTCAGIYIKGFCDSRNLPTDGIEIEQDLEYDPVKRRISAIKMDISVPDDFPEHYRDMLVKAANSCAVKKTMQDPPEFKVQTKVAQTVS